MDPNGPVIWSEKSEFDLANSEFNDYKCYIKEIASTSSGRFYALLTIDRGIIKYHGNDLYGHGDLLVFFDANRNIIWDDKISWLGVDAQPDYDDLRTHGEWAYLRSIVSHHGYSSTVTRWTDTKASVYRSLGESGYYAIHNNSIYCVFMSANDQWVPTMFYFNLQRLSPDLIPQSSFIDSSLIYSYTHYRQIGVLDSSTFYIVDADQQGCFVGRFKFHGALSIPNNNMAGEFFLYPNPASGSLTVSYGSASEVSHDLSIKNTLGQVIYSKTFPAQMKLLEALELASLAEGVYFVELRSGETKQTKKIVIR